MTDQVTETSVYPVNENGEIVVQVGTGSNNIVGFISGNSVAVDKDTNKMVLSLPSNVPTATLDDSNNIVNINGYDPSRLSNGYKFYLPWVRDASGNVQDKSYHGDGAKAGSGTATQTRGYFTTGAAGTYATGYRFEVPAGNSHVDITTNTLVFHSTINKATPAGNEYICGTQNNSTTPGLLLMTNNTGALVAYFRPFGVQNNFTAVAGVVDGTDHTITIVIDRDTVAGADPQKTYRTGYIYADGVLQSTLVIDCSGALGTPGKFVFGGYQQVNAGIACKFANTHLIGLPFSVADLPVQRIVDELNIRSAPITAALVGI